MGKTATYIKTATDTLSGCCAEVYEVNPPMLYGRDEYNSWPTKYTRYIRVSALGRAEDTGRPETLIFPCTADGRVIDWLELPGSLGCKADIVGAIHNAGYTIE
jgi:hypothetical protein